MLKQLSGSTIIRIILSEIEKAQTQSMYFSALSLSLILPDMCSKIEYGETATGDQYKAWFDKYVVPFAPSNGKTKYNQIYTDNNEHYSLIETETYHTPVPLFSGEIIYRLRCSLFHQGIPNIVNLRKREDFISKIEFTLICDTPDIQMGRIAIIYAPKSITHQIKEKTIISLGINVQTLCDCIRSAASSYHEENRRKFENFSYTAQCSFYSNNLE